MNKLSITMLALVVLFTTAAKSQTMEFKTKEDSMSYALGVSIAGNLKQSNLDKGLNVDLLAAGMKAFLTGGQCKIDPAASNKMISEHMQAEQAKQAAEKAAKAGENKAKGEAFLATNKAKAGVTTTASGLQYEVIKMGTGPKPTATDKVTTHYHGTLIDGTVFDSSVQRGQPAQFGVNQVIPGWTEALQLMPTGSKFKLFLPANIAYGDQGAGGMIGPGEALVFEVELISIDK